MVDLFNMSHVAVGSKTGGKGSWRRKAKRVSKGSQEGQKVWFAAQRLGCRDIGEIDTAAILVNQEDALSFSKPSLLINMNAHTYCLMGNPEKKKFVDVLTDFLSSFDFAKSKPKDEQHADDLGEIPENVDFSKPEEGGNEAPAAAEPAEQAETTEAAPAAE